MSDKNFNYIAKFDPNTTSDEIEKATKGYEIMDSIPTLKQTLEGSSITSSEPVRVVQKPGASERYSGGGMTVLQMLMEDVSGQEFQKLMAFLVLNPIRVTSSFFAHPIPDKLENDISMGYNDAKKN